MWSPKYQINDKLLSFNRQIGERLNRLRNLNVSNQELIKLQIQARNLSTFASTSIEGNPLLLTDVRRLLKNQPKNLRDTEREIINYNEALEYLYQKVKKGGFTLSNQEICTVQSLVVKDLMPKNDTGSYRKKPVIIRDPRIKDGIAFMPPNVEDVAKLMNQMIEFINSNLGKLDIIILASIFHKQNVIIHPFMDGNGRTTRLITTALLGSNGLDFFDILSLENYYNQNVSKYFQYVGEFGDYYQREKDIDFTNWIEYFTEGLIDELSRLEKNTLGKSSSIQARLEKHHKIILDYIKKNGSITQKEYALLTTRSLASRKKDFAYLLQNNLIIACGSYRSTYYKIRQ